MNDRASDLAALPPVLRKALDDQRSIDASVRAFERAVWGSGPAPSARPAPPPADLRTVTPFRPRPAGPDPQQAPSPPHGDGRGDARPPPAAPTEPAAASMTVVPESSGAGDAAPDTAGSGAATPDGAIPAGEPPMPADAADADPPAIATAIRDRLQPHWRSAHDRAAQARDALEAAERSLAHAPFLTRLSRKRMRRVEEARSACEEAEAVRTAVDTLWAADSMRRQYALLREAVPAAEGPNPV